MKFNFILVLTLVTLFNSAYAELNDKEIRVTINERLFGHDIFDLRRAVFKLITNPVERKELDDSKINVEFVLSYKQDFNKKASGLQKAFPLRAWVTPQADSMDQPTDTGAIGGYSVYPSVPIIDVKGTTATKRIFFDAVPLKGVKYIFESKKVENLIEVIVSIESSMSKSKNRIRVSEARSLLSSYWKHQIDYSNNNQQNFDIDISIKDFLKSSMHLNYRAMTRSEVENYCTDFNISLKTFHTCIIGNDDSNKNPDIWSINSNKEIVHRYLD